MKHKVYRVLLLSFALAFSSDCLSQHSVARQWNDALLEAIRKDFARPTVHARNLFHTSVVLYDAWSVYDDVAKTFFLGKTVGGYKCLFAGISTPDDIRAAQEETMSYAAFRLLSYRFATSPGSTASQLRFNALMDDLGYDRTFGSTDYTSDNNPAALGNYLAEQMIAFGLQDGSNEQNGYENIFYTPVNDPLAPNYSGNPDVSDPNRWQPLTFNVFIDQGGNIIPGDTPAFLGPEWGNVEPFALSGNDLNVYNRDGNEYRVYHDPGDPPYLVEDTGGEMTEEYKWSFLLVAIWSSHLDPSDDVLWDISPGSIGNLASFPSTIEGYRDFYDLLNGGDPSVGRATNPKTGEPYVEQMVPRGDYGRVLAEFWADGPDSETPPGHWFTILNYVNDHPLLEKKIRGEGPVVDDLEWDVKAYLALAGAMHDCAVSAWGVKGYYDYIRPISAIRYMADQGQSTDNTLPSYSPNGIPLQPGYVEVVEEGDPLAGAEGFNIDKIKVMAWKGPEFIEDPDTDEAGVGWILAENWWPYQRPTFVTPPFAGYVSGHSTFSRAAAEVLTLLTGDEYFPGGMGEFVAPKNEFLVFEEGPSVDVTLQWATYRDASDQTSLSRIWGGIHPPADDIPGRIMGKEIGVEAFLLAEEYFNGTITNVESPLDEDRISVYPNPARANDKINVDLTGKNERVKIRLITLQGEILQTFMSQSQRTELSTEGLSNGIYLVSVEGNNFKQTQIVSIN